MRDFKFSSLEQAKSNIELRDYLRESTNNRAQIYLDSFECNKSDLISAFGNGFKFGLERKFIKLKAAQKEQSDLEIKKSSTEEIEQSLEDGFTKMSYDIANKERYTKECLEIAKSGRSLSFFIRQEHAGLLLTTPFRIGDKEKTLIAWMWINSKLQKESKIVAKKTICTQIDKIESDSIAAVHNMNEASLSFLEEIGFKRFCIIC